MQRITITIEDDLLAEIDAAAEARGYQNRSEIILDLARAGLQQSAEDAVPSGQCVAALVYVYDHAARDLSKRLVQNFHGHHDLSLATLHVHLDDDSCMEVTALKGSERRGPALCRPHHCRTRRTLRPRGDDPDRIRQEAEGAQAAIATTRKCVDRMERSAIRAGGTKPPICRKADHGHQFRDFLALIRPCCRW